MKNLDQTKLPSTGNSSGLSVAVDGLELNEATISTEF